MKKVFIINNNYEIVEGWVDNVDESVYTESVYPILPRYVDSITSLRFKTESAAKDYLIAFLRAKVLAVESKRSDISKYKIKPRTNYELRVLINKLIIERGVNANLNDIDVSNIVDMCGIFSNFNSDSKNSRFNGDISEWDVSNVEDMCGMFQGSKFNGDISKWNVSNVKNMRGMFRGSKFNGDISKWNVSNVEDMESMFNKSPLENNTPEWYRK